MVTTPMPITLAEHDEAWRQEFIQIRSSLLDSTQGSLLQLEAIGSTAIPGMPAQPVIDVLAVRDPSVPAEEVRSLIVGTNFRRTGSLQDVGDQVELMQKPRSGRATHRVFLTLPGDPFCDSALQFRDWLLRNPSDAARYADLKRYLVRLFPDGSDDYRRGKIGFFRHIQRLYREAAATF